MLPPFLQHHLSLSSVHFFSLTSDTYLTNWWRTHSLVWINMSHAAWSRNPPSVPKPLEFSLQGLALWLVFWSTPFRFPEERKLYRSKGLIKDQADGAGQEHGVVSIHHSSFKRLLSHHSLSILGIKICKPSG